jgi:hypothetical protein
MPRNVQDRLMNWGYAICDAALRAHIDAALQTKLGVRLADEVSLQRGLLTRRLRRPTPDNQIHHRHCQTARRCLHDHIIVGKNSMRI